MSMAQHRSEYSPLRAAALAPHDFPWGIQYVHTWSLLKTWNFTQNIHERQVRTIPRESKWPGVYVGQQDSIQMQLLWHNN